MIFKEIHRSKIEFEHKAVDNFKVSEACIFYILSLEHQTVCRGEIRFLRVTSDVWNLRHQVRHNRLPLCPADSELCRTDNARVRSEFRDTAIALLLRV